MDERQFLLLRHLLKRHLRALSRRQGGIAPGPLLGLACRAESEGHQADKERECAQKTFIGATLKSGVQSLPFSLRTAWTKSSRAQADPRLNDESARGI